MLTWSIRNPEDFSRRCILLYCFQIMNNRLLLPNTYLLILKYFMMLIYCLGNGEIVWEIQNVALSWPLSLSRSQGCWQGCVCPPATSRERAARWPGHPQSAQNCIYSIIYNPPSIVPWIALSKDYLISQLKFQ